MKIIFDLFFTLFHAQNKKFLRQISAFAPAEPWLYRYLFMFRPTIGWCGRKNRKISTTIPPNPLEGIPYGCLGAERGNKGKRMAQNGKEEDGLDELQVCAPLACVLAQFPNDQCPSLLGGHFPFG